MPKYYEDKEEDRQACGGVREDLRQCLLESPCVLQENKSPKQCLREGHCRSLQMTFFACKRSMVSACGVFPASAMDARHPLPCFLKKTSQFSKTGVIKRSRSCL
uniref:Cytochrome c oxidase assembly factor 5 n=1 Tax=Strigops habroptila TaxID=2489341 RepID=A0A672ULS9_STRHB